MGAVAMLHPFLKNLVLPAAVVLWGLSPVQAVEVASPARLLTHSNPDGRTQSALILEASELQAGFVARDHVILVETSASQVGEHRQ